MIPEFKQLKKKCKHLNIPSQPYFEQAEEFVHLTEKFITDDWMVLTMLIIDMVLYPFYVLYQWIKLDFSVLHILSLIKTYQLWIDWFQFCYLGKQIREWKETVRSVGGPWISTNSPDHHVFVYADGMERIRYSLTHRTRPKKLTKRSE